MEPSARVLADSCRADGPVSRVTTMEVVMHRFVLAEFNTHRRFSRNSASSRAIPLSKQLERVATDPAIPLSFPAEQRGMQGGDELDDDRRHRAERIWLMARNVARDHAEMLGDLGVHKSIANRLLEPFMWHTVIVTSAEWENFFTQRCSPLAQPEIHAAAEAMERAYRESKPEPLGEGMWHLPLIDPDDLELIANDARLDDDPEWMCLTDTELCCRISAARCARVSYLTHDGRRDIIEDLALYDRLVSADPPHWSPLEHVCRPKSGHELGFATLGNLPGWVQLRHVVSGEWP